MHLARSSSFSGRVGEAATDVDFDQWLQDAADEVTIVSVMIVFFAWPFFQVTNSRLKRAELGAVLKEFKKRQPQKFTCLLSMWHFPSLRPGDTSEHVNELLGCCQHWKVGVRDADMKHPNFEPGRLDLRTLWI